EWVGIEGRNDDRQLPLARPKGTELITNPNLVNSGALMAGWTSTGVLNFGNGVGGTDLPKGITEDVVIDAGETLTVSPTFTADGFDGRELEINVWACADKALVPPAAAKATWSMTETSYDYEDLTVTLMDGVYGAESRRAVVPYWTESRVRTFVEPDQTSVTIRIGNAGTGAIRVAKVSAKFVD
ncbi:MAG: hypothetical protein AAF468_19900, partial [Pseudomonadota bacterium]